MVSHDIWTEPENSKLCWGSKYLNPVFLLVEAVDSNTLINFVLHRDFAYVARDKDTRILKCHVFRCDTPAKAIATSLHEICSKVSLLSGPHPQIYSGPLQNLHHFEKVFLPLSPALLSAKAPSVPPTAISSCLAPMVRRSFLSNIVKY